MTRSHLAPVSAEPAYRVPWHFTRDDPNHRYSLLNLGSEPLHGVTITLSGDGIMPATAPVTLLPGERMELRIAGRNLARSTIAVVRWFRPDDREYLWRVSF